MKKKLLIDLCEYISQYCDTKKPIALGYSGGADSKALLYLLIECKKKLFFDLHVIHIDHCWRKESTDQAKVLQEQIKKLDLPFHLITLVPPILDKNLEEIARDQRLKYFEKICVENNFNGVFLAHQAEDLAETVLKKVFEKATLCQLSSIKPYNVLGELKLYRPLLGVRKKTLIELLNQEEYIQDETNFDERFLRSRMRKKILPFLEDSFKKNITYNLCYLAKKAGELQSYLEKKVSGQYPVSMKGPWGVCYDFSSVLTREDVEINFILHKIFQKESLVVPKEQIDFFTECVLKRKTNKQFHTKKNSFFWDRNFLFILKTPIYSFQKEIPLSCGTFSGLDIQLEKIERKRKYSWIDIWQGEGQVTVLEGEWFLLSPKELPIKQKNSLKKLWNQCRVPVFLRWHFPVLWNKSGRCLDFLSGKGTESPEISLTCFLKFSK